MFGDTILSEKVSTRKVFGLLATLGRPGLTLFERRAVGYTMQVCANDMNCIPERPAMNRKTGMKMGHDDA
jgi:hypothetical protein